MEKNYLWIVSFQEKYAGEIKACETCIEEKDIKSALDRAIVVLEESLAGEYIITDIGIAAEDSRKYLGRIFPDPVCDPDPELFEG